MCSVEKGVRKGCWSRFGQPMICTAAPFLFSSLSISHTLVEPLNMIAMEGGGWGKGTSNSKKRDSDYTFFLPFAGLGTFLFFLLNLYESKLNNFNFKKQKQRVVAHKRNVLDGGAALTR